MPTYNFNSTFKAFELNQNIMFNSNGLNNPPSSYGGKVISKSDSLKAKLAEIIFYNDVESFHAFHIETKFSYTESRDFSIKELLKGLNCNPICTSLLPSDNLSLIHIAAFADSLEIFCLLVDKYGFSLNTPTIDSYIPLHFAAIYGSSEVLRFILLKNPNLANYGNNIFHFEFFNETINLIFLIYLFFASILCNC